MAGTIASPEPSHAERASDAAAAPPLAIAGIDPERGFAGGETQVLGLTLELLRRGHRAELICDPAGDLYARAEAAGVVCHGLKIRNSIDVAAALRLRRILARGRYDIVHFHTSRAHAMAPMVRGFARAQVVTRRMDYVPNRLFAPYLYNRAVDGVAAISAGVASALVSAGVPRERITIIPSGVDCDRFRPPDAPERAAARAALGIGDDIFAIGTVGMLEQRKGHRYLLAAVAELERAGNCDGLVCLIAGDGSMASELRAEAERKGVAKRVRWLGRIDDARAMLWALDTFVFPSLSEGLGVAMLEASACGLPAVASRAGGIGEIVRDGISGILVAPADASAMATAIARLRFSTEERTAMGRAARERTVAEFAMAVMASRTLALYRACIAKTEGK